MKILISFLTRTWHLVGNALNVHVLNVHVTLYNKMSSFAFGYLHDFLQGLKKTHLYLLWYQGAICMNSVVPICHSGLMDFWTCGCVLKG